MPLAVHCHLNLPMPSLRSCGKHLPRQTRSGVRQLDSVARGQAPAPAALTECLLLAGDGNETDADAAASMFDGMVAMTEVCDLPLPFPRQCPLSPGH